MLNDFSYAFRTLRKSPIFTITVVVTIALAIGASTAIFSVTNGVLLRKLPYKDPERLVLACSDMQKRNVKDFPVSNVDFLDLRNGAKNTFEDFASVNTFRLTLPGLDGTPERVRVAAVSTNFFQMMGGSIVAGRDFQDSDGTPQPPPPVAPTGPAPAPAPNRAPAAAPAAPAAAAAAPAANAPPPLPTMAILSNEYFQQRFGGDRSVIGKPLPVSAAFGPPPTIVGVLSPGFELLFPPQVNVEQFPSVWIAARIPYDVANRNNVQWRVIGRMKQGVALGQAQAEAETVAQKIRDEDTIARTAGQYFRLVPMKQHLVDQVRPAILALMGAVIFLLLIACANVANLMLVRASSRERELAVRAALGAGWWQLVRQTLAEAIVIAAVGTVIGVGLAYLGIRQLLVVAPANLPRLNAVGIDGWVLAFSVLAGLLSALLFGVVPALRTAKPNLMDTLRAAGRSGALGAAGLRNAVVVVEVALAFVLLIGSGLMFRTFVNIQRVNLGFDPKGLLTFQLLGNVGQTPQERDNFKRQLREQLNAIPGVHSVTASFPLPLAGGFSPVRWGGEEALNDASKFQAADLQIVLPGYFEAMGTRLLAGRTFTQEDSAPDRNLLIVDQALAAKAFPNEPAVGKRILFRVRTPEAQWGEIIGVVAHQRNSSLIEPGREQLYVTDGYLNHQAASWWALRTDGDPAGLAGTVREVVRKQGKETFINQLQPMDSLVVVAQAQTRFSLLLIGVFSTIAALLAGVGLYGVLATSVRQRTAEIGVRMALGAAPSRIFRLMVGKGLYLSLIGIAIGVLASFAFTRILASMLVEVKPTDPVTFVSVAALFLIIAFLASWLPALRAAGLDPTTALRNE
ncbi:MAG TPA: ABC transporter permease [Pyrinomonadaceae bacterium]|nr:ABC transporter permease [Pyrinomonadaceae bacterium]